MRRIGRRVSRAAVAMLAAGALLVGCAQASVEVDAPAQAEASFPDDMVAQMQGKADAAIAAAGATGALVGVWAPWSGSWEVAIGTDADGAPLSTDMGFRIGQLTRLMTCDALYAMAARGEIAVDAPLSDYVFGVGSLGDVRLHHLCDGTSGLGSSAGRIERAVLNTPERQWAPLEIAARGIADDRANPGAEYRDSNAGFALLGLALEKAAGASASEVIEEYVAAPLELERTVLPGDQAGTPGAGGPYLPGYRVPRDGDGLQCEERTDVSRMSASAGFTDSGVVSTLGDMHDYFRALGAGALWQGGEEVPDRWTPGIAPYGDAPSWLMAAGGGSVAGGLIGGSGEMPGYLTAGWVHPETGTVVVVVLNTSNGSSSIANDLAWQLAAIASKAPAAEGREATEFGLPWTPEQFDGAIAENAIGCA